MNGIIKVDKPIGPTSHDVVERIRKLSNLKRVGHAGTLDPFASGLLIVGIGNGTRILEYFLHLPKTYEVIAHLGIITDTYDRTGKIMEQHACETDENKVRETLLSFVGEYDQIPPMYSAKKYSGIKLYELARVGKIITMPPVTVKIRDIEIERIELPYVKFKVVVSGGTYVRALCRDIGMKLGCGAIAEELRRTEIGPFDLKGSINPFDQVDMNVISLEAATRLLFKAVVVNESGEMKMKNGIPLRIEDVIMYETFKKGENVRILNKNNELLSISIAERNSDFFHTIEEHERRDVLLRPKKVFLH